MALAFREWILTFLFIEPPFRKSWPCNHFRTSWIILTSQDFLLSRSTIAFSFPEDLSNALFSRHSFPEDLPQHYSDSARCSVGWCLLPFLVQEHICAFFATSFHSIILLNKCGLLLKYFNWKLYKKLCFFSTTVARLFRLSVGGWSAVLGKWFGRNWTSCSWHLPGLAPTWIRNNKDNNKHRKNCSFLKCQAYL